MTKSELVQSMRQFVGGGSFIRRYQLADYMGRKDPHSIDKYLRKLNRIDGDLYFLQDVAEVLIDEQEKETRP